MQHLRAYASRGFYFLSLFFCIFFTLVKWVAALSPGPINVQQPICLYFSFNKTICIVSAQLSSGLLQKTPYNPDSQSATGEYNDNVLLTVGASRLLEAQMDLPRLLFGVGFFFRVFIVTPQMFTFSTEYIENVRS